ncbi:MAG: hypothetical protein HRT87_10440 [Legionellales bacterium]|nr:hypothetical protein [Legionellales bacterium]
MKKYIIIFFGIFCNNSLAYNLDFCPFNVLQVPLLSNLLQYQLARDVLVNEVLLKDSLFSEDAKINGTEQVVEDRRKIQSREIGAAPGEYIDVSPFVNDFQNVDENQDDWDEDEEGYE